MNIYPRVASKCVHLNQTLQAQPTRKSSICFKWKQSPPRNTYQTKLIRLNIMYE